MMHRKQQSFDTTEYESYRIIQREQRLFVQKKTFTKWMNSFLVKASLQVDDIFVDLSDGRKLLKLLEIISGERLGKPTSGQMRIHKLENVNKCLKFLTEEGMKIENISAEDIVDCNQKLTLGLLWSIILRFQIRDIEVNFSDDDETDGGQKDETDGTTNQTAEHQPRHSPKEALLLWCQKRTKRYEHVNVMDFGESWRDGMAFNALIHSHRPELIDYNSLDPVNRIENLNHAFEVARDHLDIQPLLDAEDVDTDKPDEPSILTYLSSFYHTIAPSDNVQANPPEPRARQSEPKEITEEEVAPRVKSVEELNAETVPEREEDAKAIVPASEAEPQQDGDSFFIWVIVVAVGFTILRSVFHDTTNWFLNRSFGNRL